MMQDLEFISSTVVVLQVVKPSIVCARPKPSPSVQASIVSLVRRMDWGNGSRR